MNSNNLERNSVLLIHGIEDTGAVFNTMASYLRQQGWPVYTLDLVPNNAAVGLDILAQQVSDYILNTFGPHKPIDLVGFSMGGIISRYYVQRLGGINRVHRLITISSPHNGTLMAYASQRPGCLQMRSNSRFIQDLNGDAQILDQINFTSIWTPYDLMIVPANSSQMPVGKEIVVKVLLHPSMLTDPNSLAAVASALAEPINPGHQFRDIENCQKSHLGGGNI
ncbi:triacylglycerol lipase [Anabaenopsis tanganyikae CS-531]|uniref:Triacylglycerol lipase n=2 Tax=Anabaenopsis TaxID=110103 RepID=A0ABT6KBW8_9CYAN|nr:MULTISPECIES: triacylglycerol lipase [Anabaenopsis]MDB9541086.1 triacylglycerol lipase [Anabaenopsis arnoldii]MDH6093525.1 triacylglycerol lipase [Anabaenopsis arnoldii]MDH6105318.1 triacylglycerol lipase [Anabaenopsis tanganyikae CS-531]